MTRRKSPFRMSDLTRAAKALTAAGYLVAAVVITPDGSIQMTTTVAQPNVTPIATAAEPAHDDELALLHKLEAMKRAA